MTKKSSVLVLAMLLTSSIGSGVCAAKPPSRAGAEPAPAAASGRVVDYASLESEVGAVLVIDTTLNTSRRGTLVKYTNPALTLRLGPEAGSIDLSVPRESIRKIVLVAPAPRTAP